MTDPKQVIFSHGLKVLAPVMDEKAARRFLGKFAKDAPRLAEVVTFLRHTPAVDPVAYIVAAMQNRPRPVASGPKCVRCNSNPATHPHRGQGYCVTCVAVVTNQTDGEPVLIGRILEKLRAA